MNWAEAAGKKTSCRRDADKRGAGIAPPPNASWRTMHVQRTVGGRRKVYCTEQAFDEGGGRLCLLCMSAYDVRKAGIIDGNHGLDDSSPIERTQVGLTQRHSNG